jgi:hypothetical protein
MLRVPHCLDNRLTDSGKVVSPTHPPHFTPQKDYNFYVSSELHASAALHAEEITPGTHWMGISVGPIAGRDGMKKKNLFSLLGIES